jgi:Tfp pilus assembly protein PilN
MDLEIYKTYGLLGVLLALLGSVAKQVLDASKGQVKDQATIDFLRESNRILSGILDTTKQTISAIERIDQSIDRVEDRMENAERRVTADVDRIREMVLQCRARL